MSDWLKISLAILVLLLLASIPLARQVETGSIEGLITNDGGPVVHASVEARNVLSSAVFRVESDTDGRYKLENLRPGRYSLWIEARGHDSMWIQQLIVERGQAIHKDIRLSRPHPTGF